jgi:four helix bundle protein
MTRRHERLEVFRKADELVVDIYRLTKSFPVDERFGLQAQLRRASVSVPSNIVEGAARSSNGEYKNFLYVALASASEARYLTTLCGRLGYVSPPDAARLEDRFDAVVRSLQSLASKVEAEARSGK